MRLAPVGIVAIAIPLLVGCGGVYYHAPTSCKEYIKLEAPLKLTIHPYGRRKLSSGEWIDNSDSTYYSGEPILLQCIIRNTSSSPAAIDLSEFSDKGEYTDWYLSFHAKVTTVDGIVLTASPNAYDVGDGVWWSSGFLSSDFEVHTLDYNPCCDHSGDCIFIPPHGILRRVIPLDEILLGHESLPKGLVPGVYNVQLRHGGLLTNELTIRVIARP